MNEHDAVAAAAAVSDAELERERISEQAMVESLLRPPGTRARVSLSGLLSAACISALLATGAWFAADLTWMLLDTPRSGPAETTSRPAAPQPARPTVDIAALLDAHLFGEPVDAPDDAAPPETRLPLELQGIIYSDVAADARAIIARPGEPQDSYRSGETVGNNATLAEIHQSFVVIMRDGQREKLSLRTETTSTTSGRPSQPLFRNHDLRGDQRTARMLGKVQARLMTDPASVMSIMRIAPVQTATGIEGVKVFPGPEPGLFQQFRLQPGDVLLSVNQIPLDSPARGLEVLRNLTAARELEFEVVRDGKRLSYAFTVTH